MPLVGIRENMALPWRSVNRTSCSLHLFSCKSLPCPPRDIGTSSRLHTTSSQDEVLLPSCRHAYISRRTTFLSNDTTTLCSNQTTVLSSSQTTALPSTKTTLSSSKRKHPFSDQESRHSPPLPSFAFDVQLPRIFSFEMTPAVLMSSKRSFSRHKSLRSVCTRSLSNMSSLGHIPATPGKASLCSTLRGPSTSTRCFCSSTRHLSAQKMSQLVYASAAAYGDKIAICDTHGQHSYNQLLARSLALSVALRAALPPTKKRKHVALLVPSTRDYVVAQWATWMAGHTAVPLCPQHPPLQLQYFLQDSCSAAVICCSSLQQMLPPTPSLQTILLDSTAQPDTLTEAQKKAVVSPSFGVVPSTSRAMILYTSGTTGDPKGVELTHGNLSAGVQALQEAWQYCRRDVLLHCLPLHHTHGIVNALMTPLSAGGRVVMTSFKPDHIWSQLLGAPSTSVGDASESPDGDAEGAVNVFMAVPTIYSKLLDYYDQNYATSQHKRTYVRATCAQNFRLMVSGSAALPESLLVRWREATGLTLLERYGMTEIGMALTNPLRGDRKQGFVGQPFPGVKVRIVAGERVLCEGDSSCTVVTPGCDGQEGELQVKGPTVFSQYWKRPEATQKEFARKGWFKTGDTAVYSEGSYKILGRTSVDIIKSGGFKVSALGVERALLDHPHVRDVAVVGPSDPTWGQTISAVLVWSGPTPLKPALLKAWLKERLPSYQIPVSYTTVPELPRNNMGKVNKKQLLNDFFPR